MIPDSNIPRSVCIIGGGRWARTLARVLVRILPEGSKLILCSPSNPAGWQTMLGELDRSRVSVELCGFDAALGKAEIELVFVARAARDNAPTAMRALRARKRVFVEKPFALGKTAALELLEASPTGQCVTGLVFLFAPNLHRFRDGIREIGKPTHIDIRWHDPVAEVRYAEAKTYDASINCLQDSFPHIWSVLRLIEPEAPFQDAHVTCRAGGRIVSLKLLLPSTIITVEIVREATARKRLLEVEGEFGRATIDFTTEPGEALVNGAPIDVGSGFTSPLEGELKAFLMNSTPVHAHVERAYESIAIAEDAMSDIRAEQARDVLASFAKHADAELARDAEYALREIGLSILKGEGAKLSDSRDVAHLLRDWIGGQVPDNDIPAVLRKEPVLVQLKQTVVARSGD